MALNNKEISRELKIEDEMGKSLPALTVFELSIGALANDMITSGGNTVSGGITMEDVHWVLTVPAIWTDAAKQFMREAAVKAGIKTENLSIALEPEAASIFCRHLPVEKANKECLSSLQPGAKYMIMDAGGGTIDMTVHEVTTSAGLKEVLPASGGGWGGILVDNSFKELLLELFGEAVYTTFVKTNTEDWLDLWRTFESKKRTIDPVSTASITMRFPISLMELFETRTGQNFKDMIDTSKYSSEIEVREKVKIRFHNSVMKRLFNNSISTTVSHVTAVLQKEMAKGVQAILMVGGFSESKMLQEAMKREFKNVKLIIPREAASSILRGAVIFGHNPESISRRVLKKTYGIKIEPEFVEGRHPEHLKVIRYGRERCSNVFHKHVEKYQTVNVGEPQVEQSYPPMSDEHQVIGFYVFASNLNDPKYTDEDCEYVGTISVDISNLPEHLKLEEKSVSLSLTFSGTEITATARVERTGEITSASFDCLQ